MSEEIGECCRIPDFQNSDIRIISMLAMISIPLCVKEDLHLGKVCGRYILRSLCGQLTYISFFMLRAIKVLQVYRSVLLVVYYFRLYLDLVTCFEKNESLDVKRDLFLRGNFIFDE